MNFYEITVQSVFSSLQLMIAVVSIFLGIYVLLDSYHSIKKIPVEKSYAMDIVGWLLLVVAAYRIFFLSTDLRNELPNIALIITLVYYVIILQFIENSIFHLVGLEGEVKPVAGIVAKWILLNAVVFILPITILPSAQNYISAAAVFLFFVIVLPRKLKKWNIGRRHVINTMQKTDPERVLLLSILRTKLIILLMPISGIFLSYFDPSLLPIQFLVATILYIILIFKHKNYFLYLIS